jgi:hypothetical protein
LQDFVAQSNEWTAFRREVKGLLLNPPPGDTSIKKIIKVETIDKFLTKLKKPSNFSLALIEDMNKLGLSKFCDEAAGALCEALHLSFDFTLMIRVHFSEADFAEPDTFLRL